MYKRAKGKSERLSVITMISAIPIRPNIAPDAPKLIASNGNKNNENKLPIKPDIKLVNTEQAKGMRNGIDIEGVMVDKGDTRTVTKKAGGTIDICDIWLKDQEGELKVNLWGDDISLVHNGTKVRFTNGYTNTFNGEVSLVKGKYGHMDILS